MGTPDKKAIVHIDNVSKSFGRTRAVDNLDMKIMAGEFVTFLGPSGCGKSTTLRILGGFERPDKGRVILDGVDVTNQPPNKRDVNMVFQDYALFPHMTVGENIAFGLELKGQKKNEIAARVESLLEFMQLDGFRDRTPDQLSGGQRQRVALARALAPDPKLLLLDEPLGALDAKLRGQVQVELKGIQRRTGKTFFFVTHDQEEALTMSDRIVVMNAGRVEQDGTPEDLYHRPASRFVAEFIGETNLIEGVVRDVSADSVVLDWQGVPLHGAVYGRAPEPGSNVAASIRLENVNLLSRKPEAGDAINGRIVHRLFKGSHTTVDIQVGERESGLIKARLSPAEIDSLPSDDVWVTWDRDRLAVLQS
jgi:spermidine/putrescine transport system ATP-binding protein